MTEPGRVALITGATQGLGAALVGELARRLGPHDTVYATGRDLDRLAEVCEAASTSTGAQVRSEHFDVSDPQRTPQLADLMRERHGGVDIVFNNAVMRVAPDDDIAAVVAPYVEVNNFATTRILRALLPLLRDNGRFVVIASSLGTLNYLAPVLHERFPDDATLDDVDAAVAGWRDLVADGSVRGTPWPGFINIPSKVAQVAAIRAVARTHREAHLARGTLVTAVCPGMMNTPTSAAFWDVSDAPSPQEAAVPLVDLALMESIDPNLYGQLSRDGQVLPWKPVAV